MKILIYLVSFTYPILMFPKQFLDHRVKGTFFPQGKSVFSIVLRTISLTPLYPLGKSLHLILPLTAFQQYQNQEVSALQQAEEATVLCNQIQTLFIFDINASPLSTPFSFCWQPLSIPHTQSSEMLRSLAQPCFLKIENAEECFQISHFPKEKLLA